MAMKTPPGRQAKSFFVKIYIYLSLTHLKRLSTKNDDSLFDDIKID